MPLEPIEKWFKSKEYAQIDGQIMRPRKHPQMQDTPLSVLRGQAEAIFLEDKDGRRWILKIFSGNKCPNTSYLNGIRRILPNNPAFQCGTDRKVLSKLSLKKDQGYYYSTKLVGVLEDCVLMPQIDGLDWTTIADRIRDKKITLNQTQRILLCRNIAEAVKLLEQNSISHRDLSSGNVFVDPSSLGISLIDFDSVYHHSLPLPSFTAIGSEGYTAPFVDVGNIRSSYGELADRFALAALCVEFLILCPDSPFCHEGGLFNQEDINNRSGKTIRYVQSELRKSYPEALNLFNSAISSRSFGNCPAPTDWVGFCGNSRACLSVDSLPEITFKKSDTNSVVSVSLPDDPWKKKGKRKHGNNLQSNYRRKPSAAGGNGFAHHNDNSKAFLRAMEDPISQIPGYKSPTNNKLLLEPLQGTNLKSDGEKLYREILINHTACEPVYYTDFDFKRLVEEHQAKSTNAAIGGGVLNSHQIANLINGKDENGKPINLNNLITDFYSPLGNNISDDKKLP